MNAQRLPSMTPEELERIVRKAVRDELNDAGLRLDDVDHQFEARADFLFLRKMRQSVDGAASKVGYTILMAVAGGILSLIWYGIQAILPNK